MPRVPKISTAADMPSGDVTVSDWVAINNAATVNGTKTPSSVSGVGDGALCDDGLLYVRKGYAGFLLNYGWPRIESLPDRGLPRAGVLALAVVERL